MDRSESDNPSRLRSPAICSLQEEQGDEGLDVGEDGGEEGREEQPRGLGEVKSSLTSLSLIRLNRDFTGEGRAQGLSASGSVRPSAAASERKKTANLQLDLANEANSSWPKRTFSQMHHS